MRSTDIMLLILILFVYSFIYEAQSPNISDRDDAVTIASQELILGHNPFLSRTQLNNPITTGISSIILGCVLDIKHLTFLFWLLIFTILYTRDRGGFVWLGMFIILSGVIPRTLYWHLDELYFGILYIWIAFIVRNNTISGLLLSLAFFNRIFYIPMILVILVMNRRYILWFLIGLTIQVAIVILMCGFDILWYNSYMYSLSLVKSPSYPLDYILFVILPIIILVNEKWITIGEFYSSRCRSRRASTS